MKNEVECFAWKKNGTCKFGDNCKFRHDPANKGKGDDNKEKPKKHPPNGDKAVPICRYWKENDCHKGANCRFRHEGPGAVKAMIAPISASIIQHGGAQKRFVLDTGTGQDLAGADTHGEEVIKDVPLIHGAGGIFEPDGVKLVTVPELEEKAEITILKNSPDALTVGRRCAVRGYENHWKPFASEPIFRLPDGRQVDLDVDDYVASITVSGAGASHSANANHFAKQLSGRIVRSLPALDASGNRSSAEEQPVLEVEASVASLVTRV